MEKIDFILDTLDRVYLKSISEAQYFRVHLHHDDNKVV